MALPAHASTAVAEDDATETYLLIEDERGRDALLRRAKRELVEGECLVEVKDLHARRRYFTTRPRDPDARLVARAPPRLLRGSLLSVVSWYVVRLDRLDGVETHHEKGRFSHAYEVRLSPLIRGRGSRGAPLVAA